jgi:MFS family permease
VSPTRCCWPAGSLTGQLTAPLLLLLTFANGIGLAMRWPVFAAIVPQVVPRADLPAALALNGIAMNLSRVVGPVLAGALLAAGARRRCSCSTPAGGVAFVLILRWRSASRAPARCPASASSAPCAWACNFAMQSPRLRRCCCASSCSSCRPPR